jgi:xanthine dehydrogenase accessory factor
VELKDMVIVRGGGDLATGTIHKLVRCGFKVVVLETAQPTVIRRTVSFAQAVFDGETCVEGLTAAKADTMNDCRRLLDENIIPVLIDPDCQSIERIQPEVVVDAIIAKRNIGMSMNLAPIVIGLGPGFFAGRDVHAVIETNRGHNLGRVIYEGEAEPNTGKPGKIDGYSVERVIRASTSGKIRSISSIGDSIEKGQIIAHIHESPVYSPLSGVLRGMIQSGIYVNKDMKIGDVDPRNQPEFCYAISEKSRAIAGGVLEAILYLRIELQKSGQLKPGLNA